MSTKPRNQQPGPADSDVTSLPPSGDVDVTRLLEENASFKTQNDTILDALIAMQDKVATLEAAQTGSAATAVQQNDTQTELDAELAGLLREFPDYPLIDIFERRALVGLDANLDIRLKDESNILEDPNGRQRRWKLRWFNFGKEGRAQQAQAEGYLKVRWDELADQEAVATGTRVDDHVRKGHRGDEVLHKMPLKLYEYKKRRDVARDSGMLASESALKDRVANRVAGMVGARGGNADQAGSFVGAKGFSVTITPGQTERFAP